MIISEIFSRVVNMTFTASTVTVAGSPLAFGEGDIKRRVLNLRHWKEPRKIVTLLCTAAVVLIFAACAANPEKPVVISKNDGSFDRNVIQSATEDPSVDSTRSAVYNDEFTSTDKSVTFTYHINEQFPVVNNPVVEVVPHYLTEEDIQRVAMVLLGDAQWYEDHIIGTDDYTKEEILEKVNRWSQYANEEAISELYAREPEFTQSSLKTVKSFIEKFQKLYESAPSGSRKACDWTFRKQSYYFYSPEELAGKDLSEDDNSIQAIAKTGEVEYAFRAWTRNRSDYKLNHIFMYLQGTSFIDGDIYRAKLCRTEKPTEEDVSAAVAKAERMLADMELGQWQVDTSSVKTTYCGDIPDYVIQVTAVPVLNGTPAVWAPQIQNVKSDLSYASNYFLADAFFQFSANGDLVSFSLDAPIDIKEVINENVETKSLDELMERAKEHLALSDFYAYGMHPDFADDYGEALTCHVDLCQMRCGLIRVKVPNTDESYYYVPGVVLYGSADYIGRDSGTVYESVERWSSNGGSQKIYPIIALNAVDGSIVNIDF